MTNDLGMGIIALQVFEQEENSGLLSLRTGIGIASFFIQAAFVADADGMLVVMADMGASHMLRTALMKVNLVLCSFIRSFEQQLFQGP